MEIVQQICRCTTEKLKNLRKRNITLLSKWAWLYYNTATKVSYFLLCSVGASYSPKMTQKKLSLFLSVLATFEANFYFYHRDVNSKQLKNARAEKWSENKRPFIMSNYDRWITEVVRYMVSGSFEPPHCRRYGTSFLRSQWQRQLLQASAGVRGQISWRTLGTFI